MKRTFRHRIVADLTLDFIKARTIERDGCWIWSGATAGTDGYGNVRVNNTNYSAHRLAWELANGPIPEGMWVLHKCDHKPCCNPNHLFLGDRSANVKDMVAKGRDWAHVNPEKVIRGDDHYSRRNPERLARGDKQGFRVHPESIKRGEQAGNAKLTEAQVLEIRRLREQSGESTQSLSEKFGVSKTNIKDILSRKIWKHI